MYSLRGLVVGWGCFCLFCWMQPVSGQLYMLLDTTRIPLMPVAGSGNDDWWRFNIRQHTEYSVTTSLAGMINNPGPEEKGHFLLQHSLYYSWSFKKPDHWSLSNNFSHRLGIQCYFDSITRVQADENLFRTKLEYRFGEWGGMAIESELATRLFNGYDYLPGDSGGVVRALNSSFLTPLTWDLSPGLTFNIPGTGSVLLGLTGVRLTYLRDTTIFSAQGCPEYRGVKKGQNHLLEYGLSMKLQAKRTFLKALEWDCDLAVFKPFQKAVSLNWKNMFTFRPVKFMIISLQTRFLYEESISRRLRVENIFSAGISLKKQE
ncbi:MAG TPA: hypothetical protein PKJ28_07185 [Bacteroidales bacterium]|nr:hypothetical protein [Bacteroidales bacterium]HPS74306.1 hypothetical protein [Bacteroidales bacterium]